MEPGEAACPVCQGTAGDDTRGSLRGWWLGIALRIAKSHGRADRRICITCWRGGYVGRCSRCDALYRSHIGEIDDLCEACWSERAVGASRGEWHGAADRT